MNINNMVAWVAGLYCYMIVPFEIYAIEIKVLTNYLIYSIKTRIDKL